MTMASRTTYTRSNITSLILALPLDAFQSKDWAGTGDVRAGLMPTVYQLRVDDQGAWKRRVRAVAERGADDPARQGDHARFGRRIQRRR